MICLAILTMSMAACGDGIFRSRPVASQLVGNAETANNGVDAANSGSSSDVDSANSNGNTNSADSAAKAAADAAAAAKAKQNAGLDPAAVAAAERCPGLDPVLIDQLIKSGQPFEVECEIEVEVGPDTDD
jgi:hypothetical protein